MTWQRLRRWIGEHPVRAITFVCFVCQCGFLAVMSQASAVTTPHSSGAEELLLSISALAVLAAPAVIFAFTLFVCVVLGKSGQPVTRAWNAIAWSWVAASLVSIGMANLGVFGLFEKQNLVERIIVSIFFVGPCGGVILDIIPALCIIAGIRLAEWLTRRNIRRGKWEVTMPVESPSAVKSEESEV